MSGAKEQLLTDYLLQKIKSGSYKLGERIPSEYQLSEKFSVDKGTANRAVSRLVTLGYLKRTRGAGGTILLRKELYPVRKFVYMGVVPGAHSFYSRLLRGLLNSTYAGSCSMEIMPLDGIRNYQVFAERVAALSPDAIFVGGDAPEVKLPEVPVFCLDTLTPHGSGNQTCFINPDNFAAGEILMQEIVQRGHRHILHFSSPSAVAVQRERFLGALKMAEVSGVELKEIDTASLPVGNMTAFKRFFPQLMKKYSVIICENDIAAADLIGLCRRIGINIPQDISVCGYISGPEFHHFCRITSIDFHPKELGEYAFSLALRVLEGETELPQSELLPVTFAEGESLADLRM